MSESEPGSLGQAQPTEEEREQRRRLADVIIRRRCDIEQRWLESVTRALKGREVSPSELRDGMPEYLARLAEGLRGKATVEAGGSFSWDEVASEHARTRVRLGFDIDQLVHEFVVLRRVLFTILEEEEGARFDVRQGARLADLIEGAIEAAVKSYVQSRDYDARRREAEHVGFITHELRNPLTTAVLGVKQLRRSLSLMPDGQTRVLELIEKSHRRISELMDSVLLVERGVHTLEPKPVVTTLGQLLEQTLAGARLAAEAKGIHFEARYDAEVVVQVDPTLAISAIENVVQNAVKYTDAGDVQVSMDDRPGEVVLHVCDTCPGLSDEELRTIFEPFRRGHSHKPGVGLGLAIARRALEAQGGDIRVERGEDKGCHFWMTLPKPGH